MELTIARTCCSFTMVFSELPFMSEPQPESQVAAGPGPAAPQPPPANPPPPPTVAAHNGARDPRTAPALLRAGNGGGAGGATRGAGGWQGGRDPRNQPYSRNQQGRGRAAKSDPRVKR